MAATKNTAQTGSHGGEAGKVPLLLPARMLNEYAYCPRLFYLEWVQGEFRDSVDTVEGRWQHRNVDQEKGKLAKPDVVADTNGLVAARSVLLSSERHGLIARMDLIEGQGRQVTPVDYKKGEVPEHGPWEPEQVQLCAQALILQDGGFECHEGILYYVSSRRRVTIPMDGPLVARTLALLKQARQTASSGTLPRPLVDSPKCPRCSLVGICLPDEVGLLSPDLPRPHEVRRLFPAHDDAGPVYVQEQGASVGTRQGRLSIRTHKEKKEVRVLDVSQLCLFGNVQVTAQALSLLAASGIPVAHFSYGGWFRATTVGMSHKNIELRQAQFRMADDALASTRVAARIVAAKLRNQRTLLRRNHPHAPDPALKELTRLAAAAARCSKPDSLLGLEGAGARVYFSHFEGMLKRDGEAEEFSFSNRNRRPPRDPVNALLSFVYALLVKDLHIQCLLVGLDPYLGFYHKPRYGRPALPLDLAEEFRPILGDSVVLSVINNGEIRTSDFVRRGQAVALTSSGRKRLISAYERRMDTLIRHPVLRYSVSYRRIFEVQARLLARHILGELPAYEPFRTR